MKTKTIVVLTALSLLPLSGFAQSPPAPPAPAVPPIPPNARGERGDRDRAPKVPVTFLGVETSDVPSVVAEQLGLAKGFGLVVDYVVPDGPAAAAGVQVNDILKMFNDQILTEPEQLAKLVRSNAEGASVSLTVLRKGAETKLNAKLGKREISMPRERWQGRHGDHFGDLNLNMDDMKEQLGKMDFGMMGNAVGDARAEIRRARDEARRAAEEGRQAAREGLRAAAESRREAAREMRLTSQDNGTIKTTRIDLGKAQIVYNDDKGEMKIETVENKKILTAKDPQGRLLFSGPISSKEELDKVPAEVRQRYEKLEQKDLPAVSTKMNPDEHDGDDDDNDADGGDNNADSSGAEVLQVGHGQPAGSFPARRLGINTVLI